MAIVVAVVGMWAGAEGCGGHMWGSQNETTMPLTGSSIVPAANGKVTVAGEGPNQKLTITVHNLAQPQALNPQRARQQPSPQEQQAQQQTGQLSPPPQAYVTWLEPKPSGSAQNIGVLVPDNDLNAHLTTTTTYQDFDLFVTAEPSAMENSPTGRRLLQLSVRQ